MTFDPGPDFDWLPQQAGGFRAEVVWEDSGLDEPFTKVEKRKNSFPPRSQRAAAPRANTGVGCFA
jgi:hypothetical protein